MQDNLGEHLRAVDMSAPPSPTLLPPNMEWIPGSHKNLFFFIKSVLI